MKKSFYLGLIAAFMAFSSVHGESKATTSQYIHSNDTFEMTLSSRQSNALHGPPGSVHTLEFVLVNNYQGGKFLFSKFSEDGFDGLMDPQGSVYLEKGQQQTIKVVNMKVPERPEGEKVKFTLIAERESAYGILNRKKREPQGGSGSNTAGEVLDNIKDNVGNFIGNIANRGNDPTFRADLAVTVDFTVAAELEDDDSPDGDIEYLESYDGGSESSENDGECEFEPDDLENCNKGDWYVKFKIQDEDSGLHLIQVLPTGGQGNPNSLFYRYDNFPIGSVNEHSVTVSASCCLEGVMLRATDVAGNQEEFVAENGGSSGMSDGAKIAIIVICCVVGLGIIGAVLWFCVFKKRYSSVPTS